MVKNEEMSARKAWVMVLVSLIDDIVIVGLVLLGLWLFDVKITWVVIFVLVLLLVVLFFILHKAVIPAIRKKRMAGLEAMIGVTGTVTEALEPAGIVVIKGEYWKASCGDGFIEKDSEVEVVDIKGLMLKVKAKEDVRF